MPDQRLMRILSQLRTGAGVPLAAERLCEVAADVVGMAGAGIMLMSRESHGATICSSNEVSATIEELQFTLGEGPCLDAYHQAFPVLEPDLADPSSVRWPAFAPPAVAAGARAVFGFPLQVGAVCVGALDLYRSEPGPLSDDEHADATMMAGVAARSVLTMKTEVPFGDLGVDFEEASTLRLVVHQASGIVAVQLNVPLGDALVRMRAYAFANDRTVTDVAKDVVAHRIRFDEAPDG